MSSISDVKRVTKTMPIKYRTMQCSLIGFFKMLENSGDISPETCTAYIDKLPLCAELDAQLAFYDNMVDMKHIEQTFIKPILQKHKKGSVVKKPRKKSEVSQASEPNDPGTEEPGTKEPGTEEPGTEEPGTKEPGTKEPGAEDKKPVVDDKKRGRKVKETKIVFASDAKETLTDELVPETFVSKKKAKTIPKLET